MVTAAAPQGHRHRNCLMMSSVKCQYRRLFLLTDGEFTGEVMQHLCNRLGISRLLTSAYHPQTDAKCERTHFSVHKMITKLLGEKHDNWLDLLGTVTLHYNSTVHSATGYSPHELFYDAAVKPKAFQQGEFALPYSSFKSSCPLDAQVTAPTLEPVDNTDAYAMQALECMREAYAFVYTATDKQAQHMKWRYDAAVKPKAFQPGEFALLCSPKKKRGLYTKLHVTWTGPVHVEQHLNDS